MYFNIRTNAFNIAELTKAIETHLTYVELKRLEDEEGNLFASYITRADSVDQLNDLIGNLKKTDPSIQISVVDQPGLVL